MQGGPSHVNMFDYKPRLAKERGEPLSFQPPVTETTVGQNNTRITGPVSTFGLHMTDLWPSMARHSDALGVFRAMEMDRPNHPVAIQIMHTGTTNGHLPSMGAWVSYRLGTESRKLPPSRSCRRTADGERNYGGAFLPAIHQATSIQNVGARKGRPSASSSRSSWPSARRPKHRGWSTSGGNRRRPSICRHRSGDHESVRSTVPAGAASGGGRRALHPGVHGRLGPPTETYHLYLMEQQRRARGCVARCMQKNFCNGLLVLRVESDPNP